MNTITISRQMGSLGGDAARAAAERLNYRLVERELINQAARQACAPEVALAVIDEFNLLGLSPSGENYRAYIQAVDSAVKELAAQGHVIIIGRGGQVTLAGRPDVLHVRLLAPQPQRINRVANRRNISPQAARAQVEASDRFRRSFLKRYYGIQWNDPEYYDLIINTAHMTAQQAGDLICQAALARFGSPAAYE